MNPFKREDFRTDPTYCYEVMIVLIILSSVALISVVMCLPVTIIIAIAILELIIYGIQRYRIWRSEAQ
jgi:hypothetical protein